MSGLNLTNITSAGLKLEIADREFVTLVGPKGCGISRLLRLVAGLDEPGSGEILLNGRRLDGVSPIDRDVAFVPANFKPYLGGTVQDNITFPLKLRKRPLPEIKKRVDGAAELVGLQDMLQRQARSLSPEECQRLAICRAIAVQAKVLLLDDALSNLESEAKVRLRDLVRRVYQRLQVITIYGTHDPGDAVAMGERIVVLNRSLIEQSGAARELYETPANTFVARFLAGMNLVSGTLKQDRDSWVFSESPGGTIKVSWPVSKGPGEVGAGGAVLLGILPENIGIVDSQDGNEKSPDCFPAIVDLAESMESQLTLHLQTGAHTLVSRSRLTNSSPNPGRRAQFRLNNMDNICLFDPDSTRRID